MKDSYGRDISYLRVSLTDKCNLKCTYCMPDKDIIFKDNRELLTNEEIIKLIKAFSKLGITKVRFTGGEPLIRDGIEDIIKKTSEVEGIENIAITTNGVLLFNKLDKLKENGLKSVNISLDSLKRDRFKQITRGGDLNKVLDSIKKAIDLGVKVKINSVILRDVNFDEICDLAQMTIEHQIDVRFIELMPIGQGVNFRGVKEKEVLEILNKKFHISNIKDQGIEGPAKYYKLNNAKGKIGFISPITNHFCESCNRIRLTCEGFIKECLYSNKGIDIKNLIRNNEKAEYIEEIIKETIYKKPRMHKFNEENNCEDNRCMFQIGG